MDEKKVNISQVQKKKQKKTIWQNVTHDDKYLSKLGIELFPSITTIKTI